MKSLTRNDSAGTPGDFRAFAKQYKNISRIRSAERKQAVGLLTPQLIREYSSGGKHYGKALTLRDRSGREHTYSKADIAKFSKALKKSKKSFSSSKKGAPIAQLLGKSLTNRKDRASKIGRSVLYKVQGNLFHFRTPATKGSPVSHYNVILRLDEWEDHMHSTDRYQWAVKKAIAGRVSYECSCPDHRYRYRYLATINKCAIKPLEKDFPKITNPGLDGSCCKHTIKTLLSLLNSPSIHILLQKEMKKQATGKGFSGEDAKFLNKEDLEIAKKIKPKKVTPDEIDKAWKQHQAAQAAFGKKKSQPGVKEKARKIREKQIAMKAENKALKAERKFLEKKTKSEKDQLKKDGLIKALSGVLSMAKKYNIPHSAVLNDFAKDNGMAVDDVRTMGERAKLL